MHCRMLKSEVMLLTIGGNLPESYSKGPTAKIMVLKFNIILSTREQSSTINLHVTSESVGVSI